MTPQRPVGPDGVRRDSRPATQPSKRSRRNGGQLKVTLFAFVYGAFAAGAVYFGALFFTNLSLIANSASDISQTIINLPGEIIAVADPSRREERLERRINVLLMGNDARPDEDPRLVRTDTMMIVTIDPVNGTGTMLSIPRDLWVPIPVGTGASREVVEGRINEAYRTGHLRDYPGGGGALAMRTVEYNLGVPIDHYAMIDFSGFEKMVETVGGIEVDIPYEIVDYLYPTLDYGTTVIRFAPGPQNLNGLRALQYARTRHQDGDFARIDRQQQVLLALRDKALQLDMLPKLPQLAARFADSIETDLSIPDLLLIAQAARDIPRTEITGVSIKSPAVSDAQTSGGANVLQPKREEIGKLISAIFYDPLLRREAATVQVSNASAIPGVAQRTADVLTSNGWEELDVWVTSADEPIERTMIYSYAGKDYSSGVIARLLGIEPDQIQSRESEAPRADIEVVLGKDIGRLQIALR